MSIPESLQTIIEKAQIAVNQHKTHHLPFGFRQAIWAEFGPHIKTGNSLSIPAHKKRTGLALITAKHVLPFWNTRWPQDHLVSDMLVVTEEILKDSCVFGNEEEANRFLNSYFSILEKKEFELSSSDEEGVEIYAGYSAIQVLYTAIYDDDFDMDDIDYNRSESEDPTDLDTAFWAAFVYAGNHPYKINQPEKNLEFWNWWLTTAVNDAWNS